MQESTNNKKNKLLNECFEWGSVLIGALIAVVVIFTVFFRVVTVSGDSMFETLHDGDRLILITQFYKLDRGDVVVIRRDGEEPLIKRVIALGGDTLDIDPETNKVILNGKELDEPYIYGGNTPPRNFNGPYTLDDGEVFAMGDNRHGSLDSRQLGVFTENDVLGETVFRIFPFETIGPF